MTQYTFLFVVSHFATDQQVAVMRQGIQERGRLLIINSTGLVHKQTNDACLWVILNGNKKFVHKITDKNLGVKDHNMFS